MKYLITEGHIDAAKSFERESGTPSCIDLSTIQDRMEVRRSIQTGNLEAAIDKVNDLNPEVRESAPRQQTRGTSFRERDYVHPLMHSSSFICIILSLLLIYAGEDPCCGWTLYSQISYPYPYS